MAINSLGQDLAIYGKADKLEDIKDKSKLDKDAFMTLLLATLKHQSPTEPTDTEQILTQTSQLSSLEASQNTQTALEKLTKSLGNSQQFSTISAIGKTADLGSNTISYTKGSTSTFEVYFPKDIEEGTIEITDSKKNVIKTIDVDKNNKGTYSFNWNGKDQDDNYVDSATYHVNAKYTDPDDNKRTTKLGVYPIESVKFDGSNTLLKVGSSYVPLSKVKEVY
jgi:flagellar basal-body rod modification protein FlgD